MTGATVNMVMSVLKFILTKFVKNQTALVINVKKGIQILANLVKAVHTYNKNRAKARHRSLLVLH